MDPLSHDRNSLEEHASRTARVLYVLAGGTNRRFGSDKAFADLGGRRMIDVAVDQLRAVVDEIVVVRAFGQRPVEPYRNLVDAVADKGPLGGIYTAVTDARERNAIALIASCDRLGLRAEWADELARAARRTGAAAYRDTRWHGDFSAWMPDTRPALADRLEADDLSLHAALESLGSAVEVPPGWSTVVRANTPADAQRYVELHGPTRTVELADLSERAGQGRDDLVAVEEPLEIRLEFEVRGIRQTRPISITMRTPGDDVSLAVGFLHGEGIVSTRDDIESVVHCDDGKNPNVVNVRLAPGQRVELARLQRNFYTTSSCGVCGKSSLEALDVVAQPVRTVELSAEVVTRLPVELRARQPVFDLTGGIHGAGLFRADGTLIDVREDVGRHNALDKLVGARFLLGQDMQGLAVCLSGRASFELLQKALMARAGAVVAVGAPSSLAVALAAEHSIALYGFVRGDRFNRYA
jgi:FdhD protein